MLENRNLKLDLLALGLLAAVIFLAGALFSFDPADPPNHLVVPTNGHPANVCGRWGALGANLLFNTLGLGAYFLLVSLAGLDAVLLIRREVSQPWLRAGGWLISLLGVSTFAALAMPGMSPGPVIGAGGYLGATGKAVLQNHFANLGAYIVTVSMILGGLLLSTDYVLIHLLAWTVGKPTRGFGRGVMQVGAAYAQKLQRRRSDLDDVDRQPVGHSHVRPSGRGTRD